MQSLPYTNCPMNLEYVISKNHEMVLTSNMMLTIFVFISYSMYIFYNNYSLKQYNRTKYLENVLSNYVNLVELMNSDSEVFDFDEVNINDPYALINYYNGEYGSSEEDTEEDTGEDTGEEQSDHSDAEEDSEPELPSTPPPNKRHLRSNSQKIVDYRFDRDYNMSFKINSNKSRSNKSKSNKSQSQSSNTLGISGRNWHLD